MKHNVVKELADARLDLKQNISLIQAPESLRMKQPVEVRMKIEAAAEKLRNKSEQGMVRYTKKLPSSQMEY